MTLRPKLPSRPKTSAVALTRNSVVPSGCDVRNISLVCLTVLATAALGVAQTRQVLDLVRRLADQGLGVVLISHNMNDVMEVSDRVTALFLGRVAADLKTADTNHSQIVELITAGRSGDIGISAATAAESA